MKNIRIWYILQDVCISVGVYVLAIFNWVIRVFFPLYYIITYKIYYSSIDIATYIEITTIMKCQISIDIHSYSTNCLSCPLFYHVNQLISE